jgi:hypothetical protein
MIMLWYLNTTFTGETAPPRVARIMENREWDDGRALGCNRFLNLLLLTNANRTN